MRLKTSTNVSKVKRSVADKAVVIIKMAEGATAADALAQVFPDSLTAAMINHPHSIVHGYKKSIQKALDNGDEQVIALLTQAGLVEED